MTGQQSIAIKEINWLWVVGCGLWVVGRGFWVTFYFTTDNLQPLIEILVQEEGLYLTCKCGQWVKKSALSIKWQELQYTIVLLTKGFMDKTDF